MKNTCAAFITDGKYVLVCHPTNNKYYMSWSLPKGCKDDNETQYDAVIRETLEETNISLNKDNLIKINDYPYRKNKFYTLFLYKTESLPDIKQLKCTSYINELKIYEIDGFMYVTFDKLKSLLNQKQYIIIKSFLTDNLMINKK